MLVLDEQDENELDIMITSRITVFNLFMVAPSAFQNKLSKLS
jgi:hypothetical protein